MKEPYVKIDIENKVGYIEFFHPAHNSLPSNLLAELEQTIIDAGKDDSIKVMVLKSGGDRTFCAGASFDELINIENETQGKLFFSGFANVINAMRKCPKLIIGRVQGKAVGGGVGLASTTDYCLATKFASVKLSELSIGIGPFVIEPAVSRKIGLSAMSQLTIDATNFYDAEWAKDKGLYANVFDSAEALDKAVKVLAEQLCTYNDASILEMKKVFWKGTDDWDELLSQRAQTSGRLVLSAFAKEKLKGFK